MINQHLGVKGEYNIILKNSLGDVTYESGFKPNIILDNFFSFASGVWGDMSLKVGSGTTTPAPEQTGLVSYLGQSTSISDLSASTTTNGTTWTFTQSWTFTFTLGAIVGPVSELGLYFGAFENPVTGATRTRALILDSNQQPTTLTLTAQDQLIITYRILVSGSEADVTGNIVFSGSNTNHAFVIRRSSGINSINNTHINRFFNGSLIAMNRAYQASGNSLGAVGSSLSAFSGESSISGVPDLTVAKRVRCTVSASSSAGNSAGGIAFMQTFGANGWKMSFTPPLPKDNTKTLSMVLQYTYDRA